ncbi:hypothetical protein ACFQS4_05590 [Saliphagus sp. GCM10025317]
MTTEVPIDIAHETKSGDEYVVAGRTVATIERVNKYGTADADRVEVVAGLTVDTLAENETQTFADKSLRVGESVRFRTDDYAFTGTIVRVNTLEERGKPVTQLIRADGTDLPPE